MNKVLTLERVYNLGDYQSIRIGDSITEIPEGLSNNPNALRLLRTLQILQTERTYFDYRKHFKKIHGVSKPKDSWGIDDGLELIDEMEVETIRELKEILEVVD